MARNQKKAQLNTRLYWMATAFMLLTATPIGIIMVILKLRETKQAGRAQAAPEAPLGARTTAGRANVRTSPADRLAPLAKKARTRVQRGSILTAISALLLLSAIGGALTWLPGDVMWFLEEIWFPLCCTAASGGYLLSGIRLRDKVRRFRSYLSMVGRRAAVPVGELAGAVKAGPDRVRSDLEDLLDAGLLPQGFLDYGEDRLVLIPDAVRAETSKKQKPSPADRENALLAEIRQVNDLVKNEKLSAQIDQIGLLTAKILDYEKSHPQAAPQLHSFLSYYLPTTLKILRAYGQLESQEVAGENITAAMRRIEDMMDKVVEGFEKQLDQLFLGETMDITTDVEVLERMLAKDGLSGRGMTLNL